LLESLVFIHFKSNWVEKQDVSTEKMQIIAKAISEGAMAFLKAEYKILVWFVLAVAILMALGGSGNTGSSWIAGLSFVIGAFCSVLAGYIGMKVATKSNVRTTAAARTSLNKALEVAFSGGSVMGMGVVGLGVLGLGSLFLIYNNMGWDINKVITVITGFSFWCF
jgi:K(+)-stimulated pyrophosphate-energized sodium pump